MIEILLFLRKIIRPICKIGAVFWFFGVIACIYGLFNPGVNGIGFGEISAIFLAIALFVLNVVALDKYDRWLINYAEKKGWNITLLK